MRTYTCDPKLEIIGQGMLSMIENIQSKEIQPYLAKYGLTNIDPQAWYPVQRFVDVLNDLNNAPSGMANMVAVGMAVAQKLVMPPELEHASLPQILSLWNDLYHMQHRGGDIGSIKTEKVHETHYRTIHKQNYYPDDFVYGLAYGLARRFLPRGTPFTVCYEPSVPHMDEGGDVTIIDIIWE